MYNYYEKIFIIFLLILNCYVLGKILYNTKPAATKRSTPYRPRVIDITCLLEPDEGPCRGYFVMWYFNPKEMKCSKFYWGGCQGNGNRFDTAEDCQSTCLSQPNPSKNRAKWCKLSFDYGFCFGTVKRWYYDPIWKVCKETIYSGCGGNKNNFSSKEMCQSYCIFGFDSPKVVTPNFADLKKILIVDPFNAPRKKSKVQTLPTTKKSK